MNLTLEQIQDFEARAAAGETPVLEWAFDGRRTYALVGRVTVPYAYEGKYWGVIPGPSTLFNSPVAAMLCAEHLLREATEPLRPRWIPVTEKMPSPVNVLAYFTNSMGNGRTIKAVHIPRWHMEQSVYNDWSEYNEEKDEYYWPEGWYEVSECNDEWGYTFVDEIVTHWQPLPEPPRIDKDIAE